MNRVVQTLAEPFMDCECLAKTLKFAKNRLRMQKKCRTQEKLLATSSGEGIIPAPATSAFTEG